jgi:hypothetical protein
MATGECLGRHCNLLIATFKLKEFMSIGSIDQFLFSKLLALSTWQIALELHILTGERAGLVEAD